MKNKGKYHTDKLKFKMTKAIDVFIKSLEDFELANLYKFKFDTYSQAGKDLILNEIQSRGHTLDYINALLIDNIKPVDDKIRCKKCYSSKFIFYKDRIYATGDGFGLELQTSNADIFYDKYVCVICEEPLNDKNSRYNWLNLSFLKRIFMKYK